MRTIRDDYDSAPLGRYLYAPQSTLPVDALIALGDARQRRPGILSGRADNEETEESSK